MEFKYLPLGTVHYIDPGIPTIIVNSIWTIIAGAVAVVAAFFAAFFKRIKEALEKFFKKDEV